MALLFSDASYRSDKLFSLLQERMPDADLRKFPDIGNPEDIEYAIIWRPEPGSLQHLPNLKAIFATSAGVDALIHDTTLPHVPIVRNTDPALAHGVAEYVLYHVLRLHRYFDRYEQQQTTHSWQQHPQNDPRKSVVGIMGLGEVGSAVAQVLHKMHFTVRGWSRTEKHLEGIETFAGPEQFETFLSTCRVLVNVLPLTDATAGILNTALFQKLLKGAHVINVGRGGHMVEADILAALDSGQLSGATLDVFATEPLPEDSPLWSHPQITITPHIASLTNYDNIVRNIEQQIECFEAGQPLQHVVNRERQY